MELKKDVDTEPYALEGISHESHRYIAKIQAVHMACALRALMQVQGALQPRQEAALIDEVTGARAEMQQGTRGAPLQACLPTL